MIGKLTVIAVSLIIFSGFPGMLHAQSTNLAGYNIQLFQPATDGEGVMSVAGTETLGHLVPHIGLYTNLSRGLMTAGNPVNTQTIDIIDTFLTGDFLFSIGLSDYLNVGIDVPIFFYEQGRDFNTTNTFSTAGIGDIRLDLKGRLLQDKPKQPGIAFLSSIYFPSGEQSKFTGSENVSYQGRLIVDKQFKYFYLSTNVGYKFVPQQTVAGIDYDDEITFGFGTSIPLPVWNKSLELIGEVYGSTVIKDTIETTTPVEALGGIRKYFKNNLALTLAGGAGLTSGGGAPQYRIISGLTYKFGKLGSGSRSTKFTPISQTIYFDFDSYDISAQFVPTLKGVEKQLKKNKKITVKIRGHADSTGPAEYNVELSELRAKSVVDYLIHNGIEDRRITIEFFGEKKPMVPNKTEEGRAKNRRAHIEGQ